MRMQRRSYVLGCLYDALSLARQAHQLRVLAINYRNVALVKYVLDLRTSSA